MTDKIDLKFVAGLLAGAPVTGGAVALLTSGEDDDGAGAGDEVGYGRGDDRGEGEPFTSAGPPPDIQAPTGEGRLTRPAAPRTVRTAESTWEQFSEGRTDRSDRDVVRGNVIRATGGRIAGDVFGGSEHNDSWADVKGDRYLVEGRRGVGTSGDGFRTHEIIDGWGTGNVFRGNTVDLGGSGGVGIKDTVGGNTIDCDNKVIGGRLTDKGQCI